MKTINIDGIRVQVSDHGHGHPILFVHGFPLNHTMWNAQIAAFSPAHRVIAPDLRGFGNSEITSGTVSMDCFADDLHALLDALDIAEPVTVCSLSMGGYIAWRFIRKYPQCLRALILCDTRAAADTPENAQNRLSLAGRILHDGPEPATAMLPNLVSPRTAQDRPQIIDDLRSMILSTPPEGIAAALRGMAERPDSTELLPRIAVPVLLMAGTDDRITPPDEMRQLAELIPDAEFVEIPEAGHMAPMENPDAVNAAIKRFLDRHE